MEADRYGIEEVDYDAKDGKRWFYRLFTDSDGRWHWEPRQPTERELADTSPVDGVTWTPTILQEQDWPPPDKRGPYSERGEALIAAEGWFDAPLGSSGIS